jgi:ABC-type sugar transport system ATPase subunit
VVAVLTLEDVRHRRGGREVLAVPRLTVTRGERLSVLGRNGAGKTSLLRLLAVVEPPTQGRVLVDDLDPQQLTAAGLLALRRRTSYVTQRPSLLAGSVRRNVELPLAWRGVPRDQRAHLAQQALDRLGVGHLAGRRAASLSGGEAQRVALARGLVTAPSVLLLDEPAAALDATARGNFLDDLESALGDRRTTVVHVTHRPEEAIRLADRLAVLEAGTVRQVDRVPAVLRAPADAAVARLVGYENVLAAEVTDDGRLRPDPGAPMVAAWAAGLRLSTAPGSGTCFRVTGVRPGPGRQDVHLASATATVVAQLPLDAPAPGVGSDVSVSVAPGSWARVGAQA